MKIKNYKSLLFVFSGLLSILIISCTGGSKQITYHKYDQLDRNEPVKEYFADTLSNFDQINFMYKGSKYHVVRDNLLTKYLYSKQNMQIGIVSIPIVDYNFNYDPFYIIYKDNKCIFWGYLYQIKQKKGKEFEFISSKITNKLDSRVSK